MEREHLEIVRDAVKIQQRKESFERALGRAVRKRNLDFALYMKLVSEVREIAYRDGKTLDDAARALLVEKEQGKVDAH